MIIKYYFLRKKKGTQTKDKPGKYYENPVPTRSMVPKWFLENFLVVAPARAQLSRRSIEVATPELIKKTYYGVGQLRLKLSEIVEATGISHYLVVSILNDQLVTSKFSAKWEGGLVTSYQNAILCNFSGSAWRSSTAIRANFCAVSMDKTRLTKTHQLAMEVVDYSGVWTPKDKMGYVSPQRH